MNLVLANGDNVVSPLPYVVKAQADGLQACLPQHKEATADFVILPFESTVVFGASELKAGKAGQELVSHDHLSVSVQWTAGSGAMTMALVRGMPYLTANYTKLTPRIALSASPVVGVDGGSKLPAKLSGVTRIELELANGQRWALYTSSKVDATVDGSSVTFAGQAAAEGLLVRAAVVTEETRALLDAHRHRVPLGGTVSAATSGKDGARLSFNWAARGEGKLLVMALPHHVPQLGGVERTELVHNTLKGDMLGVVGDSWTLFESLPTIGWDAPRKISDSSKEDAVREALRADASKPMLAADPYGSGKEMGALARLAVIADSLQEGLIADSLRARLATKLETWLSGKGTDVLVYEPTYGGLVSTDGLADQGADFGNGWYNDHHFHYGYFLYAAAVVGKADPEWLSKWAGALRHLVRDIANPSAKDPLYVQHRYKDWYVGHCWAAGLFPLASGRNQESVSESVNAWYGLQLFGDATGDARLRDLGRLMVATEVRAARYYWQIGGPSSSSSSSSSSKGPESIYPEPFAANRLAAVVWSTKVDRYTWFGQNPEYAFGIQTMPVTPISEALLRPSWVESSRSVWQGAMASATDQWKGILVMLSAVTQPADAWKQAQGLTLFDNGNTRTNVYYWIATRAEAADDSDDDGGADSSVDEASSSIDEAAVQDGTMTTTPAEAPSAPSFGFGAAAFALVAAALGLGALIGKRYSARMQFWWKHGRPMTAFEARQLEAASEGGLETNYEYLGRQ